jgi:hypothetical protein
VNISSTSTSAMRPMGPPPGRPPKPEVDVAPGIQALSSACGISGADLLAKNPDVSAQLAQNQNRGALVDGYS